MKHIKTFELYDNDPNAPWNQDDTLYEESIEQLYRLLIVNGDMNKEEADKYTNEIIDLEEFVELCDDAMESVYPAVPFVPEWEEEIRKNYKGDFQTQKKKIQERLFVEVGKSIYNKLKIWDFPVKFQDRFNQVKKYNL